MRQIVRDNDYDSIQEIVGRMQMFSSNILGSDAYFIKHRKQLEALMQQKGPPTLWFTFLAANNHWQDLHVLDGFSFTSSFTEEKKAKH